jgi:aspartyl-tRNA(Asn)/glutamyl-tRNA(Gln) amidotransferase subunit A
LAIATVMTTSTLLTLTGAAGQFRQGAVRSIDLVDAALAAIARDNGRTNAFIYIDAEAARAAAREADRERAAGLNRGPLHGLPVSLKDLIDVKGQVTTAGSLVLRSRIADADAPAVTRLREAGAVIIGKTNLHEFALGTTSEDSAWGPVKHPADAARLAGGSSGGSAVAVALGMGLASIGTDTGGSIRIPSAACGVVGLKPTYGEVPTDGVIPLSSSLDHVGPIARTVQDAAWLWAILTGHHVNPIESLDAGSLRLRHLVGYFSSPLAPEVREAVDAALDRLRSAAVTVIAAEIPLAPTVPEIYVNTVLPEAAFWHDRYLDSRKSDYLPAVHARLMSGRTIPAVKYFDAREKRALLRREVDAALEGCDALLLPTLPIVAPRLGEVETTIDPSATTRTTVRNAMLRQTQLFNLTGHPAISLPVNTPGLPVGLQLVGRINETERLLAVAVACERILV